MKHPPPLEVPPSPEGTKELKGKLPWELLPWWAVEEVMRVIDYGAKKYSPDNWRKVTPLRPIYLAAAMRHIVSFAKGQEEDPESGLHHLAHAACCLLFILEDWRRGDPS